MLALILAAGLFALGACAPERGARPPSRYPALPAGASASSEQPAFEPAPALSALSLACRPDEPAQPNALDDDCDGHVDQLAHDDELVLAFAYPREAALKLALRAEPGPPLELIPPPCDGASGFCTLQLGARQLARGRHTLLVQAADAGAGSGEFALVVSVQSRGKVATYLAAIAPPTGELILGRLALP